MPAARDIRFNPHVHLHFQENGTLMLYMEDETAEWEFVSLQTALQFCHSHAPMAEVHVTIWNAGGEQVLELLV